VGSVAQKILHECYPDGSCVPPSDTLHYTLGHFPQDQFWERGAEPDELLDTDVPVINELVLKYTDKLCWIKKEHTTIFVFLPLLWTGTEETLEPKTTQPTPRTREGNHAHGEKRKETRGRAAQTPRQPPSAENRPAYQRTQQHLKSKADWLSTADPVSIFPLTGHQICVRFPDTWASQGPKKPAYTQTMPSFASLDSLMANLAQLLSIPTPTFCILYGVKSLTHHRSLAQQGVTKGETV